MLDLFVLDLQTGLDGALKERQQELVRFTESLWDKYRISLAMKKDERKEIEATLSSHL